MDKSAARTIVKDTFQNSFHKDRFYRFAKELLNRFDDAPFVYRGNYIPDAYEPYVQTLERIGKYQDPEGKKIDLLVATLKKESSLEHARTMQRNFIAWYLNGSRGGELKDAALVAFVAPDAEDWRFSLVKMEYKIVETPGGRVKAKEEFTPARRYSFLVGKNEATHTAQTRLVPIIADDSRNPTLAQLEDSFNIEKVTREFFEKYRELYLGVKETLDDIVRKDSAIRKDFDSKHIITVDFSKKLLGQIIFLYFLQKKGWFGVKRHHPWGAGSKHFLRELFEKKHSDYKNFFNDILEPLFYEALATEHQGDYYSRFDSRIPFLNGGLFDPISDYDWVDTDVLLPNDIFSNGYKTAEGDLGSGILDIFDRYNFTVKEDEPLEKEVAVDPEMLGKVFENLLEVKDRKSKGTYYTPREIVHHMCQQSLTTYLTSQLKGTVSRDEIDTLIKYGETVVEHDSRVVSEGRETKTYAFKLPQNVRDGATVIDAALASIRICDPAVGSGAFPVGMMNEIVRARNALTPYIGPNGKRSPYIFKRHAIQNCLYGVDLDAGAVEIAKLRLWLSLVVDEEERSSIQPLPNLDYKIVQGNSLFNVAHNLFNQGLFSRLEELKPLYFNETRAGKKQEYKRQIDDLIGQLTSGRRDFDFEVYFSEVFHEKGGFDVVIANPPYLKERENKEIFQAVTVTDWGKRWQQGKMDYWFYFLHRAIDIAKTNGAISFITSRYWLNSAGATKLIGRIKENLSFVELVDIGKLKVFDEVAGQHMVAVYLKGKDSETFRYKRLQNDLSDVDKEENTGNVTITMLENSDVFSDDDQIELDVDDMTYRDTVPLGELFDVSQGVVQNPDKVSTKSANRYGLPSGKGVFVLTEPELNNLHLTEPEQVFVKPFYDENDIHQYFIRARTRKYLLYLTKENCPDISQYPALKKHLMQYRAIMDARRETKNGLNKWFHLHWPRENRYFETPHVVLPTMFGTPIAGFQDGAGYFGLSTNVVVRRDGRCELKYLLAILNSSLANYWFRKHGKKRGVGVDIGVERLRKLPLKPPTGAQQRAVIEVVDHILAITSDTTFPDNQAKQPTFRRYMERIDELVYEVYGMTAQEIDVIEGSNQMQHDRGAPTQ